jgi:hypothetical protein
MGGVRGEIQPLCHKEDTVGLIEDGHHRASIRGVGVREIAPALAFA